MRVAEGARASVEEVGADNDRWMERKKEIHVRLGASAWCGI